MVWSRKKYAWVATAALSLGLTAAACGPEMATQPPAKEPAAPVATPTEAQEVVLTPAPAETDNPGTPAVGTVTLDETVIPAVTVSGLPTANVTVTPANIEVPPSPEPTGTVTAEVAE